MRSVTERWSNTFGWVGLTVDNAPIFADFALEDADPRAHRWGELIQQELAGNDWGASRRLAEIYPWLLGEDLGVLKPWKWAFGSPTAAHVTGPVSRWMQASLEVVRSTAPEVVEQLQDSVTTWHTDASGMRLLWEAKNTAVQTLWLLDANDPAHVFRVAGGLSGLRRLALRGTNAWEHALAWLETRVPLEELVVFDANPPSDVRRATEEHPSLHRLVWNEDTWSRRPMDSQPIVVPAKGPAPGDTIGERFYLVRQLTHGVTRRLWLAHDRAHGRAITLAFVDTFRTGRIHLDGVLYPEERIRGTPHLEVYPSDLEPLGPRPWPPQTAPAVEAQFLTGNDWGGGLEPAFLDQVFRQSSGELVVIAPPVFIGEGWQRKDIQRRLRPHEVHVPWRGHQTRGRSVVDETGFTTGPGGVFALAAGVGGNTTAEGPTARALAAFHRDGPLAERFRRAQDAAWPEVPHEQGITVNAIAVRWGPSAEIGVLGTVRVFRVRGSVWEDVTPDGGSGLLGWRQQPEVGWGSVDLRPGDGLVLCTEAIAQRMPLLGKTTDPVQLIERAERAGNRDHAAVLCIGFDG